MGGLTEGIDRKVSSVERGGGVGGPEGELDPQSHRLKGDTMDNSQVKV